MGIWSGTCGATLLPKRSQSDAAPTANPTPAHQGLAHAGRRGVRRAAVEVGEPIRRGLHRRRLGGPRIPLPVAPPVEYDAVIIDGQCNIIMGDTDVAQIRDDIPDAVIVRGVFVPTAIVEQETSDAQP